MEDVNPRESFELLQQFANNIVYIARPILEGYDIDTRLILTNEKIAIPGGSCPIWWVRGKQTFWTALVNSRMSGHSAHPGQLLLYGGDAGAIAGGTARSQKWTIGYSWRILFMCVRHWWQAARPDRESIRCHIPQKHVMSLATKPKQFRSWVVGVV